MPGVLIIEAMAQTGGLLLLLEIPDREKKLLYFVAVDDARFRRPVVPGDQLQLEVNVLSWRGDFASWRAAPPSTAQLCAEATLMCKMVDRDDRDQPTVNGGSETKSMQSRPHRSRKPSTNGHHCARARWARAFNIGAYAVVGERTWS